MQQRSLSIDWALPMVAMKLAKYSKKEGAAANQRRRDRKFAGSKPSRIFAVEPLLKIYPLSRDFVNLI